MALSTTDIRLVADRLTKSPTHHLVIRPDIEEAVKVLLDFALLLDAGYGRKVWQTIHQVSDDNMNWIDDDDASYRYRRLIAVPQE